MVSIFDPNREVPPTYLNYTVETKDGESLMGWIAAESDGRVTLRRAFGEESVGVRRNIERLQTSKQQLPSKPPASLDSIESALSR